MTPILGMGPEQLPACTTAAIAPNSESWGDSFLMSGLGSLAGDQQPTFIRILNLTRTQVERL